jgi:hypothetical protein
VDDVVRQTIRVEKEKSTKPINTPLQGFTILPEQKYGNDGTILD